MSSSEMTKPLWFRYIADVPVNTELRSKSDGSRVWLREDRLGFEREVTRLTLQIQSSELPMTVGIFGAWGSGKTSFCRMLEKKLAEGGDKNKVAITYNAWRYQDEDEPIVPLLGELADSLESLGTKIGQGLGLVLKSLTRSLSVKGNFGLPGIGKTEISFSGKELVEGFKSKPSKNLGAKLESLQRLAPLVEALHELLNDKSAPSIVIIVDDLDRCHPDKASLLLEKIKLILDLPKTALVLALNENLLADYLGKRYREDFGARHFSVQRYLNKLIQFRIYLSRIEGTESAGKTLVEHLFYECSPNEISLTEEIKSRIPQTYGGKRKREQFIGEYSRMMVMGGNYNPRAIIELFNRMLMRFDHVGNNWFREPGDVLVLLVYESLCLLAPELVQEMVLHKISRESLLHYLDNLEQKRVDEGQLRDLLEEMGVSPDHIKPLMALMMQKEMKIWLGREEPDFDPPSYQQAEMANDPTPFLLRPAVLTNPRRRLHLFDMVTGYLKSITDIGITADEESSIGTANVKRDAQKAATIFDETEGGEAEETIRERGGQSARRDAASNLSYILNYLASMSHDPSLYTLFENVIDRVIQCYAPKQDTPMKLELNPVFSGVVTDGVKDQLRLCITLCRDIARFGDKASERLKFQYLQWCLEVIEALWALDSGHYEEGKADEISQIREILDERARGHLDAIRMYLGNHQEHRFDLLRFLISIERNTFGENIIHTAKGFQEIIRENQEPSLVFRA